MAAQIHDCGSHPLAWGNAKKYGIDPQRIAVWGSSAGGHLFRWVRRRGKNLRENWDSIWISRARFLQWSITMSTALLKMDDYPSARSQCPRLSESQLIGANQNQHCSSISTPSRTPDDAPIFIFTARTTPGTLQSV